MTRGRSSRRGLPPPALLRLLVLQVLVLLALLAPPALADTEDVIPAGEANVLPVVNLAGSDIHKIYSQTPQNLTALAHDGQGTLAVVAGNAVLTVANLTLTGSTLGPMFLLSENATLILENVVIEESSNRSHPLVQVLPSPTSSTFDRATITVKSITLKDRQGLATFEFNWGSQVSINGLSAEGQNEPMFKVANPVSVNLAVTGAVFTGAASVNPTTPWLLDLSNGASVDATFHPTTVTGSTGIIAQAIGATTTLTFQDSLFEGNGLGSGKGTEFFYFRAGTADLSLRSTDFTNNNAGSNNLFNFVEAVQATVTLDHADFQGNRMGTGFYAFRSTVQMALADSSISGSTSNDYGGSDYYPAHLIYYSRANGSFTSERTHYSGNSAGYRALLSWHHSRLSSILLSEGDMSENTALYPGLVFLASTVVEGALSMSDTNLLNNRCSPLAGFSECASGLTIYGLNPVTINVSKMVCQGAVCQDGCCIRLDGVTGTLGITDSQFLNNQGTDLGGAVEIQLGSNMNTTFQNSLFAGNKAFAGAGISFYRNANGNTVMRNVTFRQNTASLGGALYEGIGTNNYFIENTTFIDNSAGVGGGAHIEFSGPLSFTFGEGVSFIGNKATDSTGGAINIYELDFPIHISGVHFQGNTAVTEGGALCVQLTLLTLENCRFTSNSALNGGGVFVSLAYRVDISGMTMDSNSADIGSSVSVAEVNLFNLHDLRISDLAKDKGAIALTSLSSNTEPYNLVFENHQGSAIYLTGLSSDRQVSMRDISFNNCFSNTTDFAGLGHALFVFEGFTSTFVLENATFTNNELASGHLFRSESGSGSFHVHKSKFHNNKAGIVYARGSSTFTFENSTFHGNTAQNPQRNHFLFGADQLSTISLTDVEVTGSLVDHGWYSASQGTSSINGSSFTSNNFTSLFTGVRGTTLMTHTLVSQAEMLAGTCFTTGDTGTLSLGNVTVAGCNSKFAPAVLQGTGASTFVVQDSEIYGVTETVGSSFVVQDRAKFEGTNVKIHDMVGGIFYVSGMGASLNLAGSSAIGVTSHLPDGSMVHLARGAVGTITGSTFHNGTSTVSGSCFIVDTAALVMSESEIKNCLSVRDGGAMKFFGRVEVSVTGVELGSNRARKGGAVSLADLYDSSILFSGCNFTDNTAQNGGALLIAADPGNSISFVKSNFRSNSATNFGGVYLAEEFSDVTFDGCVFEDNHAITAGVGYQDWDSATIIKGCRVEDNWASDNGGAFSMDKNSKVEMMDAQFKNNEANLGGGVVAMTLNSDLSVSNCNFTDNAAESNGGAITVSTENSCSISITGSRFDSNRAGERGGAVFFKQNVEDSFSIVHSSFSRNNASYGGALSMESAEFTPAFTNLSFVDNKAVVYGDDINSPPSSLSTTLANQSMLSGDELPRFEVNLRDPSGSIFPLSPIQPFFVYLTITKVGEPAGSAPYLSGPTQAKFESGQLVFSDAGFKIRAFGLSGTYTLTIGPSPNDPYYSTERYSISRTIEFRPCLASQNLYQGTDLSCQEVACSGCPTERGAVCVTPGNCSCANAMLNGRQLEGLQCELIKDSYESIKLTMSSLPNLTSKRSTGVIDVRTRDYLIAQAQAAYNAAGKNVTVKFRDLYQEGDNYVFKYSLIAQGGEYVEGEALNEYNEIATSYFSEVLGEQVQSELVQVELFYLTYSNPLVIVVLVLSMVLVATTLVFAGVVVWKRQTPVIKSASPTFCVLILMGIVLAYLTFFPYVGKPNAVSCAAPVVIGPLAFSVVFGNLLAKTFRIYRIFTNKKMKSIAPSNMMLLSFSGVIVAIEMILVIAWLAADAPSPSTAGPEGSRYLTCSSSVEGVMAPIIIAYNTVLMVLGIYFAITTRKAYTAYRESQMIGVCIYSLFVVAVAVLPVLYLTPIDLTVQFAIRSFAILFVTSVTLFMLFGKKMFIIFFSPHKNTQEYLADRESSSGPGFKMKNKPMSVSGSSRGASLEVTSVSTSYSGWLLVRDNKPWSQWKKKFAIQHGTYFGFFDNEEYEGGGLLPLSKWQVEHFQSPTGPQLKLSFNKKTWFVDSSHPEDLERWAESLSKPFRAELSRKESEN